MEKSRRMKGKIVENNDYTIAVVDKGEEYIKLIEYYEDGLKRYLCKRFDGDVIFEDYFSDIRIAFLTFLNKIANHDIKIPTRTVRDIYYVASNANEDYIIDVIKALGRVVTQLGVSKDGKK